MKETILSILCHNFLERNVLKINVSDHSKFTHKKLFSDDRGSSISFKHTKLKLDDFHKKNSYNKSVHNAEMKIAAFEG